MRCRIYAGLMADPGTPSVRRLVASEIPAYLMHMVAVDAGSGVDGAAHFHPYERSEPFDLEVGREREVVRWATAIDEVGWRRAWGLFDGDVIVGHLYLAGGMLRSELHRVNLGMGIVSSHHRRGGGSLLLEAAIAWAREEPRIDWIDLGVFSDNPGAEALYARHGFQPIGRTTDRFRVDGRSLDDISMTLPVVGS